ncbi:MAG: adenine deaminase [Negativicutes bacterium]|jgi:adenine deaminase
MIINIKTTIDAATGRTKADLLLKNGSVFNVFTAEWMAVDLAIADGMIIGWGDYDAENIIDCSGKYITPGFWDTHVHIESSTLNPVEFAKTILPFGTTTIICDPHEIANVSGLDGVEYMLNSTAGIPLTTYVMLPSCVPASVFEASAHTLTAADLQKLIDHPRVLGLGEFMNYPGVQQADNEVLAKLELAKNKIVDGHAPQEHGKLLNAYLCGGVRTEHECVSAGEAREKLEKGMYIQIREGTFCHNLQALLPLINDYNLRRCLFCTDDRSPHQIIVDGHINSIMAQAVAMGLPPEQALIIATLNAADCYRLARQGALAPGYIADVLILDDLKTFKPDTVIKNGDIVVRSGKLTATITHSRAGSNLMNTVNIAPLSPAQLNVAATQPLAKVIEVIPFQVCTKEILVDLPVIDGLFQPDLSLDVAKIVAVESHRATSSVAAGFLRGLGIKKGAIAQSIAHDAHNIIALGISDSEIIHAVNALAAQQGGIVVVENGEVIASLPLPIAGLMSDKSANEIIAATTLVENAAYSLGIISEFNPFISLSFMSLSVIPELKLTVNGLFDTTKFLFTHV